MEKFGLILFKIAKILWDFNVSGIRHVYNSTDSFRRDLAGFGTYSGGCWDSQLGGKSAKIGPLDKLNTQKYHKALAYFQDEKAADLAQMMDR